MIRRTLKALRFGRIANPHRTVEIYDVEAYSGSDFERTWLTDEQLDDLVNWLKRMQQERDEGRRAR